MEALLAAAGTLALLAWGYLALSHWSFWKADVTLPPICGKVEDWPSVAAVIPARNEEHVIPRALASVANQVYPGRLRVFVVNDNSTDRTTAAARAVKGKAEVTVIESKTLPEGWAGKLWAVSQGVAAARSRMPRHAYLWLTDADIVHGRNVLKELVETAERDHRDLVSLMVRLNCRSFWERVLVPAFIFFFQLLYPFRAVAAEHSPRAGAAGGCMLVSRKTLEKIGGIARIRTALIDDCALAAAIKHGGGRIWLGHGVESASIRPYSFGQFWMMVARTAYTQLHRSPLLLPGAIIWLGILYLAPPALTFGGLLAGEPWMALIGLGAWAVMIRLYAPTLKLYQLPPALGAALPVVASLFMLMTVHSALRHWLGRGGAWKGRTYDFVKKH